MKKIVAIGALLLVFGACRKDAPSSTGSSPYNAVFYRLLAALRDSVSVSDFYALDTTHAFLATTGDPHLNYWRIAFKGVPISRSFVILRADEAGVIRDGRLVDLVKDNPSSRTFASGNIVIRSLGGQLVLQSAIANGYILAFHPRYKQSGGSAAVPARGAVQVYEADDGDDDGDPDYQELPTATVTAFLPAGGGGGDDYVSAGSLLGGSGDYIPTSPSPIGGGGGVSVGKAVPAPLENTNSLTAVNITQMFICFDQVSDAGATYTVKLCTDVPDNNDPTATFDLTSGSTTFGHSFLVVTKSNPSSTGGLTSVTQSFGFYPAQTPSYWSPNSPVPSAIKDNTGQEINAGISINISSVDFNQLQANAIQWATNNYQLMNYNCTNYALDLYNSVTNSPITLMPTTIWITLDAGQPPVAITIQDTPQALYAAISSMQQNGAPAGATATTDLSGNTKAPTSHGQCQE
jgi:hypothetical protein